MKEIVVVTPFSSMSEVTRRVIAEHGYANVDLLEAEPGNILERTRQAIDGGAKAIISRGGFYELIKTEFDIPTIEVKVTAFDLIDTFKEVKRTVGDELILRGRLSQRDLWCVTIAEVMGLRTACFEMTKQSDIVADVERLIEQGFRVFVGDNNVNTATAKAPCQAFLVQSGSQAMHIAIQQAYDILYAQRLQKEKAQQFATIIDFVHDGIIAIDNQVASRSSIARPKESLGFGGGEAIWAGGSPKSFPRRACSTFSRRSCSEIGDIQQLDNQTVVATSRAPVVVDGEVRGAVATCNCDITDVQKLEQRIRIRLAEKGFVAQYSFSDIIHRSAVVAECIKTAKKFARYDTSVLIFGPSGVGKELFCAGIHNASQRKNSPFVVRDQPRSASRNADRERAVRLRRGVVLPVPGARVRPAFSRWRTAGRSSSTRSANCPCCCRGGCCVCCKKNR